MYKVGIWGQFGDGGPIADGQAVRTTIITKEVERKYGCENVLRVNTNNWKKNQYSFFGKVLCWLSKGSWNMAKEYEPDSVLADFYDAIV